MADVGDSEDEDGVRVSEEEEVEGLEVEVGEEVVGEEVVGVGVLDELGVVEELDVLEEVNVVDVDEDEVLFRSASRKMSDATSSVAFQSTSASCHAHERFSCEADTAPASLGKRYNHPKC